MGVSCDAELWPSPTNSLRPPSHHTLPDWRDLVTTRMTLSKPQLRDTTHGHNRHYIRSGSFCSHPLSLISGGHIDTVQAVWGLAVALSPTSVVSGA